MVSVQEFFATTTVVCSHEYANDIKFSVYITTSIAYQRKIGMTLPLLSKIYGILEYISLVEMTPPIHPKQADI